MVRAEPLPRDASPRRALASRWWVWFLVAGLACGLAPVLALSSMHRSPDPQFMHFWWTPIARVFPPALLLGSVGLDLLVATGVTAVVVGVIRRRRSVHPVVALSAAILLAALPAAAWLGTAVARSGATVTAIRSQPGTAPSPSADSTGQARRALELAASGPDAPTAGVRLTSGLSAPAGPWIVQSTEVLNPDMSDEMADVTVESLVDPISGRVVAAWFYGL